MKEFGCLGLGMLLFTASPAQDLEVMSFNIRLNIASDSANAWPYRKDKVVSQVLFHEVQVLGVQEALHEQMVYMKENLPRFNYTGGGRDDGKEKGEYAAIFYDTTILKLLNSATFWLSETPTVPGSKSWDAAITRIVTWARFRHRRSSRIFYVFNTHFDHMGKQARKESARLLLKQVQQLAGKHPAIIMGDFNAAPLDEPIQLLLDKQQPERLTDSKEISMTPHYGPAGTFNGFGTKEINDQPIDYIFIKGKLAVKKHATISESWQGRFASDHFAVLARIGL